MHTYLNMLEHIIYNGDLRSDRTGVGTIGVFGYNFKHNCEYSGFPLLTTKKIHWKSVVYELLWMLKGDTNIKYLQDNGISIWDEWADENGDLGPVYGHQWRRWNDNKDQIGELLAGIKNDPYSRRHIVNSWNVSQLHNMKLPPCHVMFQCYVRKDKYLDLQMYQRSADAFLGVPFNIASYALLLHMLCHQTNYKPGMLSIQFGDLHIYNNHLEQVNEQLRRKPLNYLPTLGIKHNADWVGRLEDYQYDHFQLDNYNPQPAIKAPVAV